MDEAQKKQVLFYLKHHDGMTSMDAYNVYGITRLAAVVYELRREETPEGKMKYNIITVSEINPKTKRRYGRYVLK